MKLSDDLDEGLLNTQLDYETENREELKIAGEVDFMEKIIDERGDNLDAAVTLAEYTLDITKKINNKVHE